MASLREEQFAVARQRSLGSTLRAAISGQWETLKARCTISWVTSWDRVSIWEETEQTLSLSTADIWDQGTCTAGACCAHCKMVSSAAGFSLGANSIHSPPPGGGWANTPPDLARSLLKHRRTTELVERTDKRQNTNTGFLKHTFFSGENNHRKRLSWVNCLRILD